MVTTKPIAIRSIETGEVGIVDTPPDDTSATIAVDVVKEAVRRYHDKVDELKRIKAFEWEVMSYLNDGTKGHGYCNFIVSLYMVNIAGSYNLPSDVTLEMILKHISDENIAAYVKEYFSEETWNNVIDSAVRNNIFPHCKDIIIN